MAPFRLPYSLPFIFLPSLRFALFPPCSPLPRPLAPFPLPSTADGSPAPPFALAFRRRVLPALSRLFFALRLRHRSKRGYAAQKFARRTRRIDRLIEKRAASRKHCERLPVQFFCFAQPQRSSLRLRALFPMRKALSGFSFIFCAPAANSIAAGAPCENVPFRFYMPLFESIRFYLPAFVRCGRRRRRRRCPRQRGTRPSKSRAQTPAPAPRRDRRRAFPR